jgi:ubiquinone/menaquinone biosynthesis C-methylase UbiE
VTAATDTDAKRAAQRWFDRRAARYERGVTSRWRDPVQRESLNALDLRPGDVVLDVGCGTGAASRAAAAVGRFVVGVDLSPKMIHEAQAIARGLEDVRFAVADSESLPFEDERFTAVLCTNSFHHYPRPHLAIREMARVLAKGGRLVLGDACSDLLAARVADRFLRVFEPGHVRLYRSGELGSFLREAGLSRVGMRRLSDGGFALVRGIR